VREERGKVILYSEESTSFREFPFSARTVIRWGAFAAAGAVIFSVALGWAFANLFKDYRLTALQRANRRMHAQLQKLQDRVQNLQSRLVDLEKADNELRLFVNLPPIDSDVRSVGVGGNASSIFDELATGPDQGVENISSYLDELERRIQLAFESRREIEEKFRENQELIKHTPSIRPVVGGRITSGFGYRLDPFIERIRHHDGVDIAAPQGTQVFAAADGVVEKVVTRARRGRGYGKEVIIDHGFGIKTRYAHLSRVLVRKGQKVRRWDVIGLVGQTGRARGPHLHYEVLVNGRPTNPLDYILN